jgi:hypothetical protein
MVVRAQAAEFPINEVIVEHCFSLFTIQMFPEKVRRDG